MRCAEKEKLVNYSPQHILMVFPAKIYHIFSRVITVFRPLRPLRYSPCVNQFQSSKIMVSEHALEVGQDSI